MPLKLFPTGLSTNPSPPKTAAGSALALAAAAAVVLASSSGGATTAPTQLAASATTSSSLFSAAGLRIDDGTSVPLAGLLPLVVRTPASTATQVKFTVDGAYLGTDDTAPFNPVLDTLGSGQHKLRYTVKDGAVDEPAVTIQFTATSSSDSGTPTSATPSAPSSSAIPTPSATPTQSSPPAPTASATPPVNAVKVTDAVTLQRALTAARPGTTITMADGAYSGNAAKALNGNDPGRFVIATSGTAVAPITLRGSRNAVLDGGGTGGGYGIHLNGASYWRLDGFTVTSASKGIVLDRSSHNIIDGVQVTNTAQEGIHLRAFSSANVIQNSVIHNTGMVSPSYGEGVYLGSAVSNWPTYTNGLADRSDGNQVLGNQIFDTAAESIDVKEGTTGGIIRGNQFGGNKIAGQNSADSWIDVKGNGYMIDSNHGGTAPKAHTTECGDPAGSVTSTKNPFCDGMQVHVAAPGWGARNTFTKNVLDVNAPGVGIWLQEAAVSLHNVITCDNVVAGAAAGRFAYNHYTALGCT